MMLMEWFSKHGKSAKHLLFYRIKYFKVSSFDHSPIHETISVSIQVIQGKLFKLIRMHYNIKIPYFFFK